MNNWRICWFFTHIFTGDFNFYKVLTARRLYKSFGVKGLVVCCLHSSIQSWVRRHVTLMCLFSCLLFAMLCASKGLSMGRSRNQRIIRSIYSAFGKSLIKGVGSGERTIVSKNWIKQLPTLPVFHFNRCLTTEYSETTSHFNGNFDTDNQIYVP
jgi:hypothetical protein